MRTSLPRWLSSFWASSLRLKRSPRVRNSVPSVASTMRQPKWRAAGDLGLLAEDHLHVFEPAAVGRQLRARQRGAVADPPAAARKSRNRRCGCSRSPESDHARPAGRPARRPRRRHPGQRRAQLAVGVRPPACGPAFSVTRKRPPGRKATPQGFSRPEATTSGRGAAAAIRDRSQNAKNQKRCRKRRLTAWQSFRTRY